MNLIIVAGANGSGKTTFSKEFIKEYDYVYLNADDIAFNEKLSEIQAGKEFIKRVMKSIENKKNILIETTLSGKYVFKLIDFAKCNNYKVELIYVYVSTVKENIKRVDIRAKSNEGHFVPFNDIIRRYKRSLKNLCTVLKIVDFFEIYLNDIEYELIADSNYIYDEEVYSEIIKNCNSQKSGKKSEKPVTQ
ncbi:zeta toxin family protein [Nautilia sp.]